MEGKGIFVHWVGTCFPTEAIQMHTVLSGKIMSPRVDDKDFSQRPKQEPKEKAIKKSESSPWEFKDFFYPQAYNGLLKWRSFRKLLEDEKCMGFFEALCDFHLK